MPRNAKQRIDCFTRIIRIEISGIHFQSRQIQHIVVHLIVHHRQSTTFFLFRHIINKFRSQIQITICATTNISKQVKHTLTDVLHLIKLLIGSLSQTLHVFRLRSILARIRQEREKSLFIRAAIRHFLKFFDQRCEVIIFDQRTEAR